MPAMRRTFVVLFCLALPLLAVPPKKKTPPRATPITAAPETLPHSTALFLCTLSRNGARTVTFKATAVGTRFFFEENGGVTVYRYVNGTYVREEHVKGADLARAVRKHQK